MSKYFNGDKLNGYEDSPITYVYGGNLEECRKVIADLETKLADTEFRYENLHNLYYKDTEELKQQLAEKEQTIEEINKEFVQAVKGWKSLVEQKNKDIAELEEHDNLYHNQLAIEQLEKVKGKIQHNITFVDCDDYVNVIEEIDNQIEELKKEMK